MKREIQLYRPSGASTGEQIAILVRRFKPISDMKIVGVLALDQLGVEEFNAHENEIIFSNCEFHKAVTVSEFISSITFESCRFKGKVVFEKITQVIKLEFRNCIFEDEVDFENNIISILAFDNIEVQNRVGIKNIESKTLMVHRLDTAQGYFILANPKIDSFSFIEFEKKSLFSIQVIKPKDVPNKWEYYIKKTHLFLNDENSSNISISDIVMNDVLVEGSTKGAIIQFEKLKLQNVEFRKLNCQSELICQQISKESPVKKNSLVLADNYLLKARLFDIDFNCFDEVFITNSIISEIQYGNIIWCDNIKNSYSDKRESHYQSKEIYRQLKVIMATNHDKISELKYHKMEMVSYLKGLRLTSGNRAEKFILSTSYLSNNHGLSFMWTLYWIVGLSLVIFNLNKYLLGYSSFNPLLFFEDAANWLLSINPIRKFSDVYKTYNEGWGSGLAIFLDVLLRIVYSYLIFQFISAFRKYIKK